MLSKIQEALAGDSDALRLYYQPIKRIGELAQPATFFEALVRYQGWDEAITAERFIPFVLMDAEISQQLDVWVLQQVARRMIQDNYRYAVNVTASSLHDKFFPRLVGSTFIGCRPHSRLVLEIIENQELYSSAIAVVNQMQDLSAIFLDDCGYKFSNFHTLRRLSVNGLKIHGSFIQSMLTGRIDRVIVQSLFGICQTLEITCICEWVETDEMIETIASIAQEYPRLDLWLQGWAIGYPEE